MTWVVTRHRSGAADFHDLAVPEPAGRAVWVCDPTGAALVLGSAQDERLVDREACAGAAVEVVRRHSGGGAVLVVPDDLLWVDLVIPATDPLWQDDVGRAFHWVGELWAAALASLGFPCEVHRGPPVAGPWSATACFGGLGPGEVTVDGRKVVGISQRRTRGWARFQCAALRRWDPVALLALLALEPAQRAAAAHALGGVAASLDLDVEVVLAEVLRRLP